MGLQFNVTFVYICNVTNIHPPETNYLMKQGAGYDCPSLSLVKSDPHQFQTHHQEIA